MKRLVITALALAVAGLMNATAVVAEDAKADPTGTWKWTVTFGDRSFEQTLKLKLEGDKLTGSMLGRNNQETPIEEATFKEGTVSFKVTRERNDQKFVTSYTGKVEGDTIKGKTSSERDGKARERDWEAKRSKE
jgi:hypothetical protein